MPGWILITTLNDRAFLGLHALAQDCHCCKMLEVLVPRAICPQCVVAKHFPWTFFLQSDAALEECIL